MGPVDERDTIDPSVPRRMLHRAICAPCQRPRWEVVGDALQGLKGVHQGVMDHCVDKPASLCPQGTRTFEAEQAQGHLPKLVAHSVPVAATVGVVNGSRRPRPCKRGSGDWESRIGSEAAITLRRANRYNRIGASCGLAFVAFAIGFQLANIPLEMEQIGITLSTLWFAAMIGFFVRADRAKSKTRRQAVAYLGMSDSARPYLPLQSPVDLDKWISAQDKPGWPRKGWRR